MTTLPGLDRGSRLVILGNSGAGKSTLARALGEATGLPVHSLDPIRWERPGVRRETEAALRAVRAVAATDAWIVEGVFGWLAEAALPAATHLVWLDLPLEECRAGLERRGPAPDGAPGAFAELLRWADEYETRATSSSRAGHAALFDGFGGRRLRLRRRPDLSAPRPAWAASNT